MRPVLSLLVLGCLACQGSSSPAGTEKNFLNAGRVCLFPEGVDPGNAFMPPAGPLTFAPNLTATVTVTAPDCLSSSCSKDARADCAATLDGNVLTITSTASFRDEGEVCTDDCGALVARCSTPPLPTGTYLVQFGDQRLALKVPSTRTAPCAGTAPG